jgi:hypothetical protein
MKGVSMKTGNYKVESLAKGSVMFRIDGKPYTLRKGGSVEVFISELSNVSYPEGALKFTFIGGKEEAAKVEVKEEVKPVNKDEAKSEEKKSESQPKEGEKETPKKTSSRRGRRKSEVKIETEEK